MGRRTLAEMQPLAPQFQRESTGSGQPAKFDPDPAAALAIPLGTSKRPVGEIQRAACLCVGTRRPFTFCEHKAHSK
jgi:hypothetical protein